MRIKSLIVAGALLIAASASSQAEGLTGYNYVTEPNQRVRIAYLTGVHDVLYNPLAEIAKGTTVGNVLDYQNECLVTTQTTFAEMDRFALTHIRANPELQSKAAWDALGFAITAYCKQF